MLLPTWCHSAAGSHEQFIHEETVSTGPAKTHYLRKKGIAMLVLSRKAGQQIVLPEQGITIDVVEVGRDRVRLGIAAPPNVPVHRREVWDRLGLDDRAPPANGRNPREPLPAAGANGKPAGSGQLQSDFEQWLAERINQRTYGRINQLSVEAIDGRIVVHGSTRSYHARQLALAAVQAILDDSCAPQSPPVEFDVEVGQVYWRTQGLTRLHGHVDH
jgi:carbon storage regulator